MARRMVWYPHREVKPGEWLMNGRIMLTAARAMAIYRLENSEFLRKNRQIIGWKRHPTNRNWSVYDAEGLSDFMAGKTRAVAGTMVGLRQYWPHGETQTDEGGAAAHGPGGGLGVSYMSQSC